MWEMKMYGSLNLLIIIVMPFLGFPFSNYNAVFTIFQLDFYVFVISYPKGKMTMKIRAAILLQG